MNFSGIQKEYAFQYTFEATEMLVNGQIIGPIALPTAISGDFTSWDAYSAKYEVSDSDRGSLERGECFIIRYPKHGPTPLVRIHSTCLTGDVFLSQKCACSHQLADAARKIIDNKGGYIFYMLGHEGRGIGLHNKLLTYWLQSRGMDSFEANRALGFEEDLRSFDLVPILLKEIFHENDVKILTNNPNKISVFSKYGMKTIQESYCDESARSNLTEIFGQRRDYADFASERSANG